MIAIFCYFNFRIKNVFVSQDYNSKYDKLSAKMAVNHPFPFLYLHATSPIKR